jgi:hypothetical protein
MKISIFVKKSMKKTNDIYSEARRHYENAVKEFDKLSIDEFQMFYDSSGKDVRKTIRKAGHLFYSGALMAIDKYLKSHNIDIKDRFARPEYRYYRQLLNELQKRTNASQAHSIAKIMALFDKLYELANKSLAYDGNPDFVVYPHVKNVFADLLAEMEKYNK